MKNYKIYIIGFALFISDLSIHAQACVQAGNIFLNSQADVTNFQTNYGPCDSIIGGTKLIIDDTAGDITDLSALSDLVYSSWTEIYRTDITSLSGLENLSQPSMTKCIIVDNPLLTDISQLSGITPAGSDWAFVGSPLLTDLTGIHNNTSYGTSLTLRNLGITNLDDLSALTNIAAYLTIEDNANLTDISGLANMSDFGAGANGGFNIRNNPNLSDCGPICSLLKNIIAYRPTVIVDIQGNIGDCISEAQVLAVCPRTACNQASITLASPGQLNTFQQNYGPCDSITNRLTLSGGGITDLNRLRALEYVNNLWIQDNPVLPNLDGLEGIQQSTFSSLSITGNSILNDISALENASTSIGNLGINNNPELGDLSPLASNTVIHEFQIVNMPKVVSLDDFASLNTVGKRIRLEDNANLFDIGQLSNVTNYFTAANNSLQILNNPKLHNCEPICPIVSEIPTINNLSVTISGNLNECATEGDIYSACCDHPDYAALEAFYNATGGDNWTDNTGWLGNCDPCGNIGANNPWSGINCIANRVTALTFGAGSNLVGYLPEELGDLDALEHINLNGSDGFTGGLPESMCNLSNIRNISISNFELGGSIPACFEDLVNLQTLYLQENNFVGPLPDFSNATNLTSLRLYNNNFSGTLPLSIANIPSLDELWVQGNNFSGHWPSAYTPLCTQLSNSNFDVNVYDGVDNFISDQGFTDFCAVFTGLKPCTDLHTVVLDNNFEQALIDLGIDSEGNLDGCVLTSDLESVTELDLEDQNISNLTGINGFVNLEKIYIKGNNFTEADLRANVNLQYVEAEY